MTVQTVRSKVEMLADAEERYLRGKSWRCKESPTGAHHWVGQCDPAEANIMTCRYCGKEKNKQKHKEVEMAKVTKKVKETNGNGAGKLAEEAMAEALNLQGDTDEKLATARMKVAKAEAEGAPDSVKAVWEQRVQFLENLKKEEERPMGKKEKKATEKKVAEAKEAKEKKETKPAKAAAKAAPKATLKAAAKPAKAVKAVKADKPKVDKPKKEPKPKKEGVECFCGCKQTTNPGREYRMGHDARFKSMVKKYLRKEVKLTELPERVQHLIKTNNPAVVKVKTEIGA